MWMAIRRMVRPRFGAELRAGAWRIADRMAGEKRYVARDMISLPTVSLLSNLIQLRRVGMIRRVTKAVLGPTTVARVGFRQTAYGGRLQSNETRRPTHVGVAAPNNAR